MNVRIIEEKQSGKDIKWEKRDEKIRGHTNQKKK